MLNVNMRFFKRLVTELKGMKFSFHFPDLMRVTKRTMAGSKYRRQNKWMNNLRSITLKANNKMRMVVRIRIAVSRKKLVRAVFFKHQPNASSHMKSSKKNV